MSDTEASKRLQLATRLHGGTMPVIEKLMTTAGAPTIGELHVVCNIAERVERAGDMYGTKDPLFTALLVRLMQTTEDIRAYDDERMLELIAERAARADPAAALKALEAFGTEQPQAGDVMPAEVAGAIEQRMQQLADAGGGGVLDAGDLTEAELEMIRMSEVAEEVPEKLEPFDKAALSLSARDRVLMRTKWVLVSDIRRMLDDAGIDSAALAEAAGEDFALVERWLRGVVRHVSLDTLTVLCPFAAEKAEWPDLEWVIRGLPDSEK